MISYLVITSTYDKYVKETIKMQSNSIYLYQNKTDVQISDNTMNRRNIVVYASNLVLHKGVDNALFFQFKNSDQRRVPIGNLEFCFTVFDERSASKQILFELPITHIDATTGKAGVTVPEQFLYTVETGQYEYAITSLSLDGTKHPTFVDDNLGMRGTVDIRLGAAPEFTSSHILVPNLLVDAGPDFRTEAVSGLTQVHENQSLHTIIVKFADGITPGYTGDLTVQATMDNILQQTTNITWFDVTTFNYTDQEDNVTENFTGVFTGVRFVQTNATDGKISEIQYRF